jgi:hypothetical protein
MAGRKHTRSARTAQPDRFHVGQTCALVLDASTGYRERDGALVVVLAARRFGHWGCDEPGSGRPAEVQPGLRYAIRCPWGTWYVEEAMLRAIYDGEARSTWEELERTTGIRGALAHAGR